MKGYKGIIKDPRSAKQKAQDYKHSDVYGITANWVKKDIKDLKHYIKRYQSSSLSCVAQSGAKAIEVMIGKIMSAHPPYRSRANYSAGGMWTADLGNVLKKIGTTLEELDPSQNLGESFLNLDIKVPTPYKIGGYVMPDSKKIDEVATAIETYGHCVLIFHANGNEWREKPVYNGKSVDFGHAICAVDYFLDENGVKCLYIEDSASPSTSMNKDGHRVITEDYLIKRCSSAIYFTSVNPLEVPYVFTKTLKIGSKGFDVKKLQIKLGLTPDGIFGKNTKKAVISFQIKNVLEPDGVVGPKTNVFLNK